MSKESKNPLIERKPSNSEEVTTPSIPPSKKEQGGEKEEAINHPINKQSPSIEQSYSSSSSPNIPNVNTTETTTNDSIPSSTQSKNVEATTRILVSSRISDQDTIPGQQKPFLTPIRSLFQFDDKAPSETVSPTVYSNLLRLPSFSKSFIPTKEAEKNAEEIIERSRSTKPNKRRSTEIISDYPEFIAPPASLKRSRSLSPSSVEGRALQLPPNLTKASSFDESFERMESPKSPYTTYNRSNLSFSPVTSPRTPVYSPFITAGHETERDILETEEEKKQSSSKRNPPILTRLRSSTGDPSTLHSNTNTKMKKEQQSGITATFPDTSAIIDNTEIQKLSEKKQYKFKEYVPKIDIYQHQTEDEQEEREYNKGPWTNEEHEQFMKGFKECGRQWKIISEQYVKTRDRRQVSSHAQKHIKKSSESVKGDSSASTSYKAESTPQASTSASQESESKVGSQEILDNLTKLEEQPKKNFKN